MVGSSALWDCFGILPLEIRQGTAAYLPTGDYLRPRETSKSFSHVFPIQTFWATRFTGGEDRGVLFGTRYQSGMRDRGRCTTAPTERIFPQTCRIGGGFGI